MMSWYLMKGHIATNSASSFSSNFVQSCIVLSTCLMNCLWLFSRSYAGSCSTKSWSCTPSASSNYLPFDILWYLMLTPIMYLGMFPYISLKAILVSWFIAVVWISFYIYFYNAYNTLIIFVFYIPTSLKFIYKKQNERYLSLLEKENYQAKIEEMEILSVNKNKEMKNMTHDIKKVNTIT